MQITNLKIALDALAKGDKEAYEKKLDEFMNNINEGNQRYKENNLLMFGPLNEINEAVCNFSNAFYYPVLTIAKSEREALLLLKDDGTRVRFAHQNTEEAQK